MSDVRHNLSATTAILTERGIMAAMVREQVLDPLAVFAGMLIEQNPDKHFSPDPASIGRTLKIMIEGAHVELALYCSPYTQGPVSHALTSIIAWSGVGK